MVNAIVARRCAALVVLLIVLVSAVLLVTFSVKLTNCEEDQDGFMEGCLKGVCSGQCLPLIAGCKDMIGRSFKPICNVSCTAMIDACAEVQPHDCDGTRAGFFASFASLCVSSITIHILGAINNRD